MSQEIDFTKSAGLVPAIIQDAKTDQVLMLGYMNQEALEKTKREGFVTFFSRSKDALWTKGETSGNRLKLVSLAQDCDNDTLLIKVHPEGPVCHTGAHTCFNEVKREPDIIDELVEIIGARAADLAAGKEDSASYTIKLLKDGIPRIAQKVGEEGVEVALAAVCEERESFVGEVADLFYHTLVLLQKRGCSLDEVKKVLIARNRAR
jgi:phosphoribosyl-ATP pyrophosphohydrolase/phosphoribosyl-AMP cyclohydrolase